MAGRLGIPGISDEAGELVGKHYVMAAADQDQRLRRPSTGLRASAGFGALEQAPAKARSGTVLPGLCSAGDFWRRCAQADKH